ncbi:MAG: hypothetical protein GY896_00740 [Gammaproteobacteria bacterium]|nr:hypothetical protein [Gammaproteobacteria bacterium]
MRKVIDQACDFMQRFGGQIDRIVLRSDIGGKPHQSVAGGVLLGRYFGAAVEISDCHRASAPGAN